MVYAADASKWRAYQFLDPFAAGSFLVCNKVSRIFCRPDCDAHPTTELRSLIKFIDTTQEAVALGYVPCDSCGPMSVPKIDVNLLLRTVKDCNNRIGFVPPLMDDDESKITEAIKENIIGQEMQRRQLVPAVTYNHNKAANEKSAAYSVSKNDSEHYRLIDLACRHLALAAANLIFTPSPSGSLSPGSDDGAMDKKKNTKKRRGGVLGFKELAAKSKLSAWHFHRVFKGITGLTPKNYGDMCWEYLEKNKSERGADSVLSPPASMRESPLLPVDTIGSHIPLLRDQDQLHNNALFGNVSNPFSYISPINSSSSQQMLSKSSKSTKRARTDDYEELEYSPKRAYVRAPTTSGAATNADIQSGGGNSSGYSNNTTKYDSDFGTFVDFSNRATSVPDLVMYGSNMPSLLFDHNKPVDFGSMAPAQPLEGLDVNEFSPTSAPMNNAAPLMIHDPFLPTEDIVNQAVFGDLDVFPDEVFSESRGDLFSAELAMNDPQMMGLLPEVVSTTE